MSDKIFLVFHDDKVFVTSGGLSFVDIIYVSDFVPLMGKDEEFYIEFDYDYIEPWTIAKKYNYHVHHYSNGVPQSLITQLNIIRDSISTDEQELEAELQATGKSSKIDINKRLFYETVYRDGTVCKVNNQPRITRVHFYCDQYRSEKDQAMSFIDISEPDYCEYLFKISTRFMCAAGTQFRKASVKLHMAATNTPPRPELDLDIGIHTVKKHLNCEIKSDF